MTAIKVYVLIIDVEEKDLTNYIVMFSLKLRTCKQDVCCLWLETRMPYLKTLRRKEENVIRLYDLEHHNEQYIDLSFSANSSFNSTMSRRQSSNNQNNVYMAIIRSNAHK